MSVEDGGVRRIPTSPKPVIPIPPANNPKPAQQAGGMSRTQQVVLVIIGVLAVVGVGLGLFALTNQPSIAPLQQQIDGLKAVNASQHQEIAAQHQQIAALKTDTATLKAATASAATAGNLTALQTSVSGLATTMKGVQGDLGTLHICLPELNQEVNGLNVNTFNTGGYLTDAYLTNPTIISTNCTKFLTGQ
jgi:hypothetical protein